MFYILLVLCCLCLIWRSRLKNQSMLEPPVIFGKLPLIGHGHWLIGNTVKMFNSIKILSEALMVGGGSHKLYLGPRMMYAVADPEDCLTITNSCLQKHYIYDFARPLFSNGLLTADVPTWKKHRKLLNPAFSQHVLDGFIQVFNDQSQILVDQFGNEVGKPFDHECILRKNNLETICLTATGVDLDDSDNIQKQYLHGFEEVLMIFNKRVQKFWLHSDFIYNMSSLKKKQDKVINYLVGLSNTIIQRKKTEMKNSALQHRTSKISSFTDEQIRGETDTIIAGGHDTSASALTFCLTLLGSNAQIQEKAYAEIFEVLGNSRTHVESKDLSRLVYIEAILKETLRLYPSVPIIVRQLDRDIRLKQYTLKANTGCFIFIYGIHRHKIWGSDADTFRPERWLEKETLPDPKYFAAFGLGRRSCIGKVYAMMSMKIALAKVLQKYRISSDVSKMVLKIETMIRPESGHYITLEKRNI